MSTANKKYKYYNITIWLRNGSIMRIDDIGIDTYERLIRVWNKGAPKLFRSMRGGRVITLQVSEIIAVDRVPST